MPPNWSDILITYIIPFVLGIVSSLAASWLLLSSDRANKLLVKRFFARFYDFDRYYPDRETLYRDLSEEIRFSRKLKIISVAGMEFSNVSDPRSFEISWPAYSDARIILLNPYSKPGWKRANEVKASASPEWRIEEFPEDIHQSIRKFLDRGMSNVRLNNYTSAIRLIITDSHVYFSGYPQRSVGYNVPVYRFPVAGYYYSFMEKYFEEMWDSSIEYQEFFNQRDEYLKAHSRYEKWDDKP